jgi:hypothetical protein
MSQKCAHTSFTFYSHVTFTYVHTYMCCTLYRYTTVQWIYRSSYIYLKKFNFLYFNKARFSTNIHTLCDLYT